MKPTAIKSLFIGAALCIGTFASATTQSYIAAGATGVSASWQINNVPAGARAHSYVTAESGSSWTANYEFGDQSWTYLLVDGVQVNVNRPGTGASWSGYAGQPEDPGYASASVQAGIAGPPNGEIYLAQVNVQGPFNYGQDEKWATLVGGTYQMWVGGGSSGAGMVTGATEITW